MYCRNNKLKMGFLESLNYALMIVLILILLFILCLLIVALVDRVYQCVYELYTRSQREHCEHKAEQWLLDLDKDNSGFEYRLKIEEDPDVKDALVDSIVFNRACREDITKRLKQFKEKQKEGEKVD